MTTDDSPIRGGYGKHFSSMYSGSLVGEGPLAFALMGYVIANQKPVEEYISGVDESLINEDRPLVVELNPKLLAAIIGQTNEKEVAEEIEKLCRVDEESRSEYEGGRRLVRVGSFAYWVVNGRRYREARVVEDRRRQNREAQQRFREKKKRSAGYQGGPLPGEKVALEHGVDIHENQDKQKRRERLDNERRGKEGGTVDQPGGQEGVGGVDNEARGVVHHGGGRVPEGGAGLPQHPGGQLGNNSGRIEAGDQAGGMDGNVTPVTKSVPRGILLTADTSVEHLVNAITHLPVRKSSEAIRKILFAMPCQTHEGMAQDTSAFNQATQEEQLSKLRSALSEARETRQAAVSTLREFGVTNAPPGLQQTAASGMAVPKVSPETPRRTGAFKKRKADDWSPEAVQAAIADAQRVLEEVQSQETPSEASETPMQPGGILGPTKVPPPIKVSPGTIPEV